MLKVLDLFCGAGGLASGFSNQGFDVTGVDSSELAGRTFVKNHRGKFVQLDLSRNSVSGDYDVIIGGPPCKPWSNVNTVTRGSAHRDYHLLGTFFRHVESVRPAAFLFENVLPVKKSGTFRWWVARMQRIGYSVDVNTVAYSSFGAATRRQRLIAFGLLNRDARSFYQRLERKTLPPSTVRSKIWDLRDKNRGASPDHVWPQLKTIDRYREYYRQAKYGWYVLKWDEPAPSFGNVTKTYILHPESLNGGEMRVISIREAALIMGFEDQFEFPRGSSLTARYQMIADAVSPDFSIAAARATMEVLGPDGSSA
jgi:DNA (cytosine-5)-methyltransferase 1